MTREEAIEEINKTFEPAFANYIILALGQPEIIRCKDCIHSSGVKMVDGWTYCAEGRLLVKYEDGYCSDARRREE